MPGHRQVVDVVIDISESTTISTAVDASQQDRLAAVIMPAAMTGATASIQTSTDGVTFNEVRDDGGVLYTLTFTANAYTFLDDVPARSLNRFIRLVSASAELADRTYGLVFRTDSDG